jgi:thiamine biosynthesis protein ThiI
MLSGGLDSPVAGYMMARRGMIVTSLHFTSEPYTSAMAKDKVVRLSERLGMYTQKRELYFMSLTEIQEAIRAGCREDYHTLILRRFMVELAERVARRMGALCLVSGESLGQVASQTLSALAVTDAAASIPVFRPCIGMDKEQIVASARLINTYDISVEPHPDCCTVFTPRHPSTNPKLETALGEEAKLDRAGLMERAMGSLERYKGEG